jgi:hypothetical protein
VVADAEAHGKVFRVHQVVVDEGLKTPSLSGLFWGAPGGGRDVCGGVRSANQSKVTR